MLRLEKLIENIRNTSVTTSEQRQQLGAHTPELRARVARMQRGELHRDAGPLVHATAAGVGAIATQAWANLAYRPDGMRLLGEGKSAQETLDVTIGELRRLADGIEAAAQRFHLADLALNERQPRRDLLGDRKSVV